MNKDRILYLDIIKVIAFFMVIFNHCEEILISKSITLFHIHNVMFYFCKAAVPLFFMISGALLIEKRDTVSKIISRIIRLLIPLILISLMWSKFKSGYIDFSKIINPSNNDFFAYWLWFLIPMIIIYIFLPLIRKYTLKYKDSNLFKKIIFLLLLFISIIFTFLDYKLKINLLFITNIFPLPLLYFVYGYLLSKGKRKKIYKNISFITLFIGVLFPTLIAYYLKINAKSYYFLDDYKNIFSFLISISLFIIIKYFFEKKKWNNSFTKVINHLASDSYGIYLFHVFVIEYMMKTVFMKELMDLSKLESVFVLIAIVVIVLDIPIYILKKIPVINKLL